MTILDLAHQIWYCYYCRNLQRPGQDRTVGGLAPKFCDNAGYIFRSDPCCHGRGKILRNQDGACRKCCDIHALQAKQFPLHTLLDITHVGCSLLHQLVIHGCKHIRIGGADLLDRIFCADAFSGNGRLNLSGQHRIHQKHHMALHDLCFLLPYSGRKICRKLLGFLKRSV